MNIKSNFKARIVSSVLLVSVFSIALIVLPILQYLLLPLIAVLMLIEWYNITKSSSLCLLLGLIAIPLPIISLMLICELPNHFWIIITYGAIISSVDTFAMFGGKIFQGPKLARKISPSKTWSGLIIGVISVAIVVNLLKLLPNYNIPEYLMLHLTFGSIMLAVLAQVSDLFESYFKRCFGFKDSGSIIPGHGGVLDRFDGLILTAPVLLFLLIK